MNDKEFKETLNLSRQNAAEKEERYKNTSRDRLNKIAKKKIQTTMIGALSSIEKHFGFLWDMDEEDLTDDQIRMKNLYDLVRQEILDIGNNQIRNIETELNHYDIEWKRYTLSLPVKTKKEG